MHIPPRPRTVAPSTNAPAIQAMSHSCPLEKYITVPSQQLRVSRSARPSYQPWTVSRLLDNTTEHAKRSDWHERGCIAGRGVLIDFKSYAEAKGIEYSPCSAFQISIADIEAVAAYQNTTFQTGDILIVRFGFTEALSHKTGEEQAATLGSGQYCGLEGSIEMAKWLWNKHFAAVASDNLAVEVVPPVVNGQERPTHELGEYYLLICRKGNR